MNWKVFITASISAVIIAFPANIIGCGPEADPYDYYTSFFHQNLPEANGYKPFYYTGYNFLYDEKEPVSTTDLFADEWAVYCGKVTKPDAKKLVTKFSWKDLNNLYQHVEKNQPLKIPDSVKQNSMTEYFLQNKDLEALGYIMYSKRVEPYVLGGDGDWDLLQRDSVKMAGLIKNGKQLYSVAKKDFFKSKYAYQILRLAHYSGRYRDVIAWYDDYAADINKNKLLQPLCLSLKAGALFHTGNQKEAAYLFSKSFTESTAKRISNYLGFNWSVDSKLDKKSYVEMGKTNSEKAAILSLFALGSTDNDLDNLKEIYELDPSCEQLDVLVVREINKLEEKYLTPALQKEKGGKTFYFVWTDANSDSIFNDAGNEAKNLVSFLQQASQNNKVKNAGLLLTAAGYAAYMIKDFTTAKNCLALADKTPLTQKLKDQVELTKLLITITETEKIDAAFETQLLPSLQWLLEKVKTEKTTASGYWEIRQWHTIYRDLLSEIIARRYHLQNDLAKEALAIGSGDWVMKVDNYYSFYHSMDFLRNNLMSKDVERLYGLIDNKQPSAFDSWLINHNSISKKVVVDFAGTSYLREYNFSKAIDWFKKSAESTTITKNPFIDILYDREEQLPFEKKFKTTKLAFAREMLKLEQLAKQPATAAASQYKLALGMYNMTYYGHAWELVQYYRSGTDGYYIPKDATDFQKEYYGAFKAKEFFEKAMNSSYDKNFKARCLFMIAKCAQKQVLQPQYGDFETNWNQYDVAMKDYWPLFTNNKYFGQFVKDYGNTTFYKEAYNSCSYLRDFVKQKK